MFICNSCLHFKVMLSQELYSIIFSCGWTVLWSAQKYVKTLFSFSSIPHLPTCKLECVLNPNTCQNGALPQCGAVESQGSSLSFSFVP